MKCIIFDTETTGLVKTRQIPLRRQPEIIEFYGVKVDLLSGKVYEELHSLFKPQLPVSEVITQITGITNDTVAKAPAFRTKAAEIVKFLQSGAAVCAHNLRFDMDMIEIELERCGLQIQWPTRICTVEATFGINGKRMKLGQLHEHLFKENFEGAHRAKSDVKALSRCAVELRKIGMI